MKQSSKIILALSLVDGVGSHTIKRVLERLSYFKVAIEALQSATIAELSLYGLTHEQAVSFQAIIAAQGHEHEYALAVAHHARIITYIDDEYPDQLRHIAYPPFVLYCAGDHTLLQHDSLIAFVGARKGDTYGRQAVQALVPPLAQNGVIIVSGGARGVDTFAHEATLHAGGKTIAVLGSGFLHLYPKENKNLFLDIIRQGGLLLSSFKMSCTPFPGNFPERNRIISGLSSSVVIVQGERNSGAGITAAYALEQGKNIYAVPGSIFSSLSSLPHYLLSQGAVACTGPEVFGLSSKVSVNVKAEQVAEHPLFALCLMPKTIDELIEQTGLDAGVLFQQLFELQCNGDIEQDVAGRYVRIKK
jgi:DNA processing protein